MVDDSVAIFLSLRSKSCHTFVCMVVFGCPILFLGSKSISPLYSALLKPFAHQSFDPKKTSTSC